MEYHKIHTIWKRDEKTHKVIEGQFSLPEFEYLSDNAWTFTEKVDGTNIRITWNGEKIIFGGKTDAAQIPAPLVARLQEIFIGKESWFIEKWGSNMGILYGEGYGAKIQKGGGNYKAIQDFVLFDAYVGFWLERHNVQAIAADFNIPIVPVVLIGPLLHGHNFAKSGYNSTWGNFLAEGLVGRPTTELRDRRGDRIICKIKYKDFEQNIK